MLLFSKCLVKVVDLGRGGGLADMDAVQGAGRGKKRPSGGRQAGGQASRPSLKVEVDDSMDGKEGFGGFRGHRFRVCMQDQLTLSPCAAAVLVRGPAGGWPASWLSWQATPVSPHAHGPAS